MGRYEGLITGKTAKLPTTAEIDVAKSGSARTMVVQPASEDDMNKTERLYSEELELMRLAGSIRQWKFGSLKLRLADRTWYHPDFVVVMPSGWICLDEIKGFEREDAVVKFKVAAEMYPYFRFRMIKRIDGRWVVTRDLNQGAGV